MKVLKEIISWSLHIGAALILAMAINIFLLQPTQVIGCSMESTLHEHDRLLISKLNHTFRKEPGYGDIVILDSRVSRDRTLADDITDSVKYNAITQYFSGNHDEVFYVKRIIGLPGDTIEIREGRVYRNGKPLTEKYIKEPMFISSQMKYEIKPGYVFVMGDNRNNSKDSRQLGPIPISHIIGKSILKF